MVVKIIQKDGNDGNLARNNIEPLAAKFETERSKIKISFREIRNFVTNSLVSKIIFSYFG